ncbi:MULTISPECIES: RAD55 family ATPase [Methanothermobacter]|uniref:RAD55 family ATPase n=1 Tax=Methanothermobacter TaxID=145260 RepID=UPI001F5B172F|nr:RAD55 family ATPase [Methanothermobacter sp. THM-2]
MRDIMSENYTTGIAGLDDILGEMEPGSVMLVTGPPKAGKSVLATEFIYRGLQAGTPCLFIAAEYGYRDLQRNTMAFNWFIQTFSDKLHVIDLPTGLGGVKPQDSGNVRYSALQNTTDLMVKVGIATRSLYQESGIFLSAFDSASILLAFNPPRLVLRVLKAYNNRVREANGIALVAYTDGVADPEIENGIPELFDVHIRMDGSMISARTPTGTREAPYRIGEQGLLVG